MHLLPEAKVKEVHAQDELVSDLLTMMLDIMKGVHDKAPVRKKDDDHRRAEERQRCFHGPKTGQQGSHDFEVRMEGGWKCRVCSKYTTTHMGWRRL
eukprot:12293460-Heterocapsa_arctica.AAC.1